MASKDRILHSPQFVAYSQASLADNAKKANDEENRDAMKKIGAVERNNGPQQQAHKLNVFERNYQYARIYNNKRCAVKAEMDAFAKSQCHFKASPMPIPQSPEKRCHMSKFTVPYTPEVLKRTPRS